ncbi:MAG: hypothetical protein PHE25_02265 [Candidatus Gracilibacteria bacterium]|nr:hypothetical protein [Candidatus Gracilibacteria bacterium]
MEKKDGCGNPRIYNEKNISSEKWKKLIENFDFNAFKNVVFPYDKCGGCNDGIDNYLTINYKGESITIDYDSNNINYTGSILNKEKVIKFLKIWNDDESTISILENNLIESSKDCPANTIKSIIESISSLKGILKCNYDGLTDFNGNKYEQYNINGIQQNIDNIHIYNKIETLKVLKYSENNFIIFNDTLSKLLVDDIEYKNLLFYNLLKQEGFFVLFSYMDEKNYITNSSIRKTINTDGYLCSDINIKNINYKKNQNICMDISDPENIQIKSRLEKISNLDLGDLEKITNEFLEKNNHKLRSLDLKVNKNNGLIYRYSDIEKAWYIIYNLESEKEWNQFGYYKSFKIDDTSKKIIEIKNGCSARMVVDGLFDSEWVEIPNLCDFHGEPIPKSFIDLIYQ